MAKVLACPSCGYKHSLDEMDMVDAFECESCSKNLVVPEAAKQFMKEPMLEAVVVARSSESSLPPEDSLSQDTLAQNSEAEEPKIQVVGKSGGSKATTPEESARQDSAPRVAKKPKSLPGHISAVEIVVSWFLAIPAGFLIVVIVPRLFGYGFHASDFVGVITNQGFGRFKIVFTLIFLWSVAAVISLMIIQKIMLLLFHRKAVSA